ncbi:MAG: N-acetylglutaminylglutamine synthetase, partial [bacterium]|nr:N-acetylglutaminylglutamine synthetase [bacterium]
LDPSTTYRLDLRSWRAEPVPELPFRITKLQAQTDLAAINRIYSALGMVGLDEQAVWQARDDDRFDYYVVRPLESEDVIAVALAVDHQRCFDDLQNGASLWALAVDPQTHYPAVGAALVRHVADHFAQAGRSCLDLSVLKDNEAAIALYKNLGFERVPVLAIKRRNQINEPLFIGKSVQEGFNPYATIIINEALRRGIAVTPLDVDRGYFRLTHGNRRVTCRESLTDLTSAIAMSRCADKQLTAQILADAGLYVPDQVLYTNEEQARKFLEKHRRIVVKPVDGEQGAGVSVDLSELSSVLAAVKLAEKFDSAVLMEQFVEGLDLRIIVINREVVAAAVRRPAEIVGTGRHTIEQLIQKVSRRREAATDGESSIPLDEETRRCIRSAGYDFDTTLPSGEVLRVRKTANLHTGGTINDVTPELSPTLREAACHAAAALEIPVVGLDFLVPNVSGEQYCIIEANERPGLANHEPQPTAERLIDLLFPHTQSIEYSAATQA